MLPHMTKRDFISVKVRDLETGRLSWNHLGGPSQKAEASVRDTAKEKADKMRHDGFGAVAGSENGTIQGRESSPSGSQ